MAKKAKASTKSPKIRNYKAANPNASPQEIADALAKAGIAVSARFVSIVLRKAKKKGGKAGKRGGRKSSRPATAAAKEISLNDSQHAIQAKRDLGNPLGAATSAVINTLFPLFG